MVMVRGGAGLMRLWRWMGLWESAVGADLRVGAGTESMGRRGLDLRANARPSDLEEVWFWYLRVTMI